MRYGKQEKSCLFMWIPISKSGCWKWGPQVLIQVIAYIQKEEPIFTNLKNPAWRGGEVLIIYPDQWSNGFLGGVLPPC